MLLRHDGSYRNRVGTLIYVQSVWQCPSILGLILLVSPLSLSDLNPIRKQVLTASYFTTRSSHLNNYLSVIFT